ncbi:MAG: hypothetical protein SOZ03_05465 [Eubacteriales bacterium]|nr:hypothetical protein [Eubacteriales bacterium]
MKRIPLLSIAILLAMCLAACALPGASTDNSESSAPTATVVESTGTEAGTGTGTNTAIAPPPDGSFTTDRLAVTEKGGVYYMNFVNGNAPDKSAGNSQLGEILFDSVDAFYAAARGVDSSHENTIKTIFSRTESGILTVDTARLYRPTLPADVAQSYRVSWRGSEYGYYISSQAGSKQMLDLTCTDIAAYRVIHPEPTANPFGQHSRYMDEMMAMTSDENATRERTEGTFDGVPCESVTSTFRTASSRLTRLTVQDGDRTVTIFLHYLLSVDESQAQSGTRVSDTMPDSVFMRWSTEKDAFTVSIYNVETVPTLEWLLSIDLVPYNPNQGNP